MSMCSSCTSLPVSTALPSPTTTAADTDLRLAPNVINSQLVTEMMRTGRPLNPEGQVVSDVVSAYDVDDVNVGATVPMSIPATVNRPAKPDGSTTVHQSCIRSTVNSSTAADDSHSAIERHGAQ